MHSIRKHLRAPSSRNWSAARLSYDVLVVGGGPAGSVVARRLALDGMRVALLTGEPKPGCEGLSRRTRELLFEEGLESVVPSLKGPMTRGGEWGAGRPVFGFEWLADRTELARQLREAAMAAGVILNRATVIHIERNAAGWRLVSRTSGPHKAPTLIDARGRHGPEHRGPLLLAVGQRFQRAEAGRSGTGIYATRDGWCWIAEERDVVWVQLVGRPRPSHPARCLAANIAQIPALARALEGAVPCQPAVARPAHARLARETDDQGFWRVGDAALALDPLSGQGLYEALRAARLIATAVRSVHEGSDASLAQRFVADRRQETWRRSVAAAATFYGENAMRGPFWSQVANAYAALIPPRAHATPAIERRPVLADGTIRERAVLVTVRQPRGVWKLDGVSVVDLIDYVARAERVTASAAAAEFDRPPAALEAAFRWLKASGALSPAVERRLP